MSATIRRELIKRIIKRGVDLAQDDPVMKELLRQSKGESLLFYIEDLKAPYGIEIKGTTLQFSDKPDLEHHTYGLIASCKEDTIIHILKGVDPMDAFFYGLIDVVGKGWFKKVMILKRIFKLGEDLGLKQKVVH